jgi:hypothetical protein
MRFVKRLHILFFLFLSLGVFSGQLLESFSLSDDVSNDFVDDSAAPVASKNQEVAKNPGPALDITFRQEPVPPQPVSRVGEPTIPSGRDLLRLLSIQRK